MYKKIKNGLFVTVEGGEGSGKTSLIESLREYYTDNYYKVITTKEPGGSNITKDLREIILNNNFDPIVQLLLFCADRYMDLKYTIIPALDNGYIVFCDRYVTSNIVYQGIVQKVPKYQIEYINKIINTLKPDLEILLDIPAEIGLKRIKDRKNNNNFDKKSIEFHRNINRAYFSNSYSKNRCVIDGKLCKSSILEEATSAINKIIESKFSKMINEIKH